METQGSQLCPMGQRRGDYAWLIDHRTIDGTPWLYVTVCSTAVRGPWRLAPDGGRWIYRPPRSEPGI